MIGEIFRFLVYVVFFGGFGWLIFLFLKEQLRKAQKWRQIQRWAKDQDYELARINWSFKGIFCSPRTMLGHYS